MIDLTHLGEMIESQGQVARVVVAACKGSTPRETGTAMLITADAQYGTIGGGRLEFDAVKRARALLAGGPVTEVRRQALGPALHQCCGGSVTLVTESWDAARYRAEIDSASFEFAGIFARRVEGDKPFPDRLRRRLQIAAGANAQVETQLADGWLIERVWRDRLPVLIYGAGHVGRALAQVLAPLPQFDVSLIDVREDQFAGLPDGITQCWTVPPHDVMASAAPNAAHFIMTPDHDYDLELCHRLLGQPFGYAGLIGSATKWARFRKRLSVLGHSEAQIARLHCPIGQPDLGKHPQAIAVGVAVELLSQGGAMTFLREVRA